MESVKVDADQVLAKVQQLIHEGNVRRVVIKHGDHSVAEFPLTVGLVGVAIAPMLAAVGAIAALVTECTIEVERHVTEQPAAPAEAEPMAAAETAPTEEKHPYVPVGR